jgi:hypothetical protein
MKRTKKLLVQLQQYLLNIFMVYLAFLEAFIVSVVQDLQNSLRKYSETVIDYILSVIDRLLRVPLLIAYYVYVAPLLFVIRKVIVPIAVIVGHCTKHSKQFSGMQTWVPKVYLSCEDMLDEILARKVAEVIPFCIRLITEVSILVTNIRSFGRLT